MPPKGRPRKYDKKYAVSAKEASGVHGAAGYMRFYSVQETQGRGSAHSHAAPLAHVHASVEQASAIVPGPSSSTLPRSPRGSPSRHPVAPS